MCVYDLYLTLLETYREELAMMRSTLRAQDVLASTWPEELKVRWVLLLGLVLMKTGWRRQGVKLRVECEHVGVRSHGALVENGWECETVMSS